MPGERLAHDQLLLVGGASPAQVRVELVGLGLAFAASSPRMRRPSGSGLRRRRASEPARCSRRRISAVAPPADGQPVPGRRLGPGAIRVDRRRPAHHVVVDAVLRDTGSSGHAVDPRPGSSRSRRTAARAAAVRSGADLEHVVAELRVRARRSGRRRRRADRLGLPPAGSHDQSLRNQRVGRTWRVAASGPRLRTTTRMRMSVGVGLRVVDLDDPVAVVVEDAGVEQLVLRLELRASPVLDDQVVVRERRLRVVVAPAEPGAAGHGVEVPPVLLDVLAVVALAVGQPEHPLLEDRVPPVPQREARHSRLKTSEMPAIPSSFQR